MLKVSKMHEGKLIATKSICPSFKCILIQRFCRCGLLLNLIAFVTSYFFSGSACGRPQSWMTMNHKIIMPLHNNYSWV